MRKFLIVSAAALSLAACANRHSDGYYDTNGNYVVPPVDVVAPQSVVKVHKTVVESDDSANPVAPMAVTTTTTTIDYSGRPYKGYIYHKSGVTIPASMEPPLGSCRIWYTDRPISAQMPIEQDCENIRSRVPGGAYLIYGTK